MIRRPPRSTLFPTRRSSDLAERPFARRTVAERELAGAAERIVAHDDLVAPVPPHVAPPVDRRHRQRRRRVGPPRSEEHTSELQSPCNLVCRLLLEKKKLTST